MGFRPAATQSGSVTPFRPEAYGAKRDGATDDTAALKACVQAACTAAVSNGTYYAEVQLTAGVYQLSGTLTQGGATKGNSLVPLPVFPDTGQKMILVLRGTRDQGVLWHWNQTVAQTAGAVLRTTVTGTNDATFGAASVIGGPTPQQGYGGSSNVWSNMKVVVDGVGLVVPNNPAIHGFDFRGIAQMEFINGACLANATPATVGSSSPAWQVGLLPPENNNNAISRIGMYSAEGINYGLYANEHLNADEIVAIYCAAGLEAGSSGLSTAHGMYVKHLQVEASQVGIGAADGVYPLKLTVEQFDFENISFALINDPNSYLLGEVKASGIGVSNLLVDAPTGNNGFGVRGAGNLRVIDKGRQKGVQTSPGIPATTVALRNPFFRDAMVHVAGGTVTNIQITDSGGSAQSVGVTSGAVLLPTGAYITLSYSVAPTWKWTLL